MPEKEPIQKKIYFYIGGIIAVISISLNLYNYVYYNAKRDAESESLKTQVTMMKSINSRTLPKMSHSIQEIELNLRNYFEVNHYGYKIIPPPIFDETEGGGN